MTHCSLLPPWAGGQIWWLAVGQSLLPRPSGTQRGTAEAPGGWEGEGPASSHRQERGRGRSREGTTRYISPKDNSPVLAGWGGEPKRQPGFLFRPWAQTSRRPRLNTEVHLRVCEELLKKNNTCGLGPAEGVCSW